MKKKLEKLTLEQENQMHQSRDEWIDFVLNGNNNNNNESFLDIYNKIKDDIWWRYEKADLQNKKPFILIADSYFGEKLMINFVRLFFKDIGDQVEDQVGAQVGAQVRDQVRAQVGAQVWDQVEAQVGAQVEDQVRAQVRDQVWDQVWAQVRDQVRDQVEARVEAQVRAQVEDQVRAQVWDQVWAQVEDQVGAQVGAQVRDQVWAQVWDQVEAQVGAQVEAQVGAQVEAQVGDQVRDQVRDQVEDQVGAQVRDQVRDQVGAQVEAQKLEFIEQGFGLGYEYWLSFYSYFEKVGIVTGAQKTEFDRYLHPYQIGKIWSIQYFENFVFICRLPKTIIRDSSNRLHSTTEAAVQWNGLDYFGKRDLCFIHGVFFEKEEWTRIVKNEISSIDLLKMENKEKQRAALSVYSTEKLIKDLFAEVIDIYKNPRSGDEIILYVIDKEKVDLENDIHILKYKDPSTNRIYVSGVPENIFRANEAIAWKFGLTVDEYENEIVAET